MLNVMRKGKASFITALLFGALIIFFVINFGPGSFTSGGCGEEILYAAKVNGVEVSRTDFEFAHNSIMQAYKKRFGDKLDKKLVENLHLRDAVVDNLVNQELLAQAAAQHGLLVSRTELEESIRNQPVFQTDGKFSYRLYQQIVSYYYRSSPTLFEQRHQKELLADKMRQVLTDSIQVADEEIRAAYLQEADKVEIKFVALSREKFAGDAKPKPGRAAEILQNERQLVEDFYGQHGADYNKPEQVRARHILIKLGEEAPAADQEAAQKKAEDILAKARGGEDFAKLAQTYSDDPGSKNKGGDLGFFARGAMVKPFEDAAFGATPGQLTGLVQSPFGYHIIKVEERKEKSEKKLDEVAPEVAGRVALEEAASAAARARAREIIAQLAGGKKLGDLLPDATAKSGETPKPPPPDPHGLAVRQAPEFSRAGSGYLPGLGKAPELFAAAFKLSPEKPFTEQPLVSQGQFYVLELVSREKPDLAKLAQEKEALARRLALAKQDAVIKTWLDAQREKAKIDVNPAMLNYDELMAKEQEQSSHPKRRRR